MTKAKSSSKTKLGTKTILETKNVGVVNKALTVNKNIWWYVRYGFWSMLLLLSLDFLGTAYNWSVYLMLILEAALYFTIVFVFVNSIRHLPRYEHKAFALTSMCLSFFLLVLLMYTIIMFVASNAF